MLFVGSEGNFHTYNHIRLYISLGWRRRKNSLTNLLAPAKCHTLVLFKNNVAPYGVLGADLEIVSGLILGNYVYLTSGTNFRSLGCLVFEISDEMWTPIVTLTSCLRPTIAFQPDTTVDWRYRGSHQTVWWNLCKHNLDIHSLKMEGEEEKEEDGEKEEEEDE